MTSLTTANLGFPRIGRDRELKWALERHWRGELDPGRLTAAAQALRATHWHLQAERGIDRIPSGDFSYYDHVLDTVTTLGAAPPRFGTSPDLSQDDPDALATYFRMPRGGEGTPPLELTKWFDTNYHYLVPELRRDQTFRYASPTGRAHLAEAAALGIATRPVLLGPLTFLRLSKRVDGGPTIELLDALLPAYEEWVADLVAAGAAALQIDEPALVLDLSPSEVIGYRRAYTRLRDAAPGAELTVATYFGALGPNTDLAVSLPIDVLHLDLVRAPAQLAEVVAAAPATLSLSLGLVDGRNIWRADLEALAARLLPFVDALGPERVQLAPSCSLLHVPFDSSREDALDAEMRGWLSFAVQRLDEVSTLAAALGGDEHATDELHASAAAGAARAASPRVRRTDVRQRLASVTPDHARRTSPYTERTVVQRARLGLPVLPTTTIGSFPQTDEIRRLRARHRHGQLDTEGYDAALEEAIRSCIQIQDELGLDVLVHGEFERTDMVEFFGEQLDGFATTSHGWVQSYGSRSVKPPILFGDVARQHPMTTRWSAFAASLTDKPMKGMLTGPVTILQWSFVRDDQPESDTARQVALALRDEVLDLEALGLPAIQIDEPALREGLPLRRADRHAYLAWASEAFRLTSSGVRDDTQIHTHMCYAELGEILQAIVDLDADVISMEASRSGGQLLEELRQARYPNEVGPGVWDIHSPRVPDGREVDDLLQAALQAVPAERLWVNPDCGLKTRDWPEVEAALRVLVAAAASARASLERVPPG